MLLPVMSMVLILGCASISGKYPKVKVGSDDDDILLVLSRARINDEIEFLSILLVDLWYETDALVVGEEDVEESDGDGDEGDKDEDEAEEGEGKGDKEDNDGVDEQDTEYVLGDGGGGRDRAKDVRYVSDTPKYHRSLYPETLEFIFMFMFMFMFSFSFSSGFRFRLPFEWMLVGLKPVKFEPIFIGCIREPLGLRPAKVAGMSFLTPTVLLVLKVLSAPRSLTLLINLMLALLLIVLLVRARFALLR